MKIEVRGKDPKICIVSGTHGDEFGVISSVEKAIKKYSNRLPDFVWIPEVSPSAVALKTRDNAEGVNLNRNFREGTMSKEASTVMEELKKHHFGLLISFHEDLELDGFYCYDSETAPPPGWEKLCAELKAIGIPLMSGIDDPDDSAFGLNFKNGYCYDTPDRKENGALESWAYLLGVAARSLTPEIPGRLSAEKKDEIVDAIFASILLSS